MQPKIGVSAPTQNYILAAQDTGFFTLLRLESEPASVSNGFFNQLSMINKMEMLENDVDDPNYQFVVGTNNGVATLLINKMSLTMTLARDTFLAGKVVNNLLMRGKYVIAFVHDDAKFYLIDR